MSYSQALEEQLRWLRWIQVNKLSAQISDWQRQRVNFAERALVEGETFYWAPDISKTISQVARQFPSNWQFTMDQLPCRSGFFWFPSGLPLVFEQSADDPSEGGHIQALLWSSGVSADSGRNAANLSAWVQQAGSPVSTLMSAVISEGRTLAQILQDTASTEHPSGSKWGMFLTTRFAACLTFLHQRILVAPQQRAERSTRKRLEHDGFTHEPLVRVVELRRKQVKSKHHGESEPVEWSHQWIVSGHWRQQWYPSLNANQPIWVMPYVKGPEDKPLKPPRAKVFAVVR